ncbi:MAG: hypothetical protein WD120_04000, partial [Gemmatimonadota bacterium]
MLVVMKQNASEEEIGRVVDTIQGMGYDARPIPGKQRTAVGLIGNDGRVDSARLEGLPGVLEVITVSHPYKQVSREWKEEDTIVTLPNGTRIGGREIAVMAGPCAVESREQILEVAHSLRDMGATILRGGAFKPRTSPYSFQGLGEEGLELLAEAREATGMSIVTEALERCDRLGDKYSAGIALAVRGFVSYSSGDLEDALNDYNQLLASARQRSNREHEGWATSFVIPVLLALDRLDDAQIMTGSAMSILDEVDPLTVPIIHGTRS